MDRRDTERVVRMATSSIGMAKARLAILPDWEDREERLNDAMNMLDDVTRLIKDWAETFGYELSDAMVT